MWKKTMCKLLTAAITCTLISSTTSVVRADEVEQPSVTSYEDTSGRLLPLVHNIKTGSGTLQISKNVNILGADSADKDSIRILLEFLSVNNIVVNDVFNKESTTIALGEEGTLNSEAKNLEGKLNMQSIKDLKEEGYLVSITSEANDVSTGGTIFLKGKDGDGTFYAVKTLIQLAENNNDSLSFNNVFITDEPSMGTRGIVEGFYGTPWNQSKRLDQIRFYGDYKMNTYIYAPKDDPYHRTKWRDPYPESEMGRMKELINTAKENKVDFVFAISPGIDIRFDGQNGEDDFNALITKCESLYDMGVRSFAILYDDINNKEGDKQAKLLNRFNKEFIKTKDDVKPLITVPTEYDTRAMGVIGDLSTYTNAFSKNLDKDIMVMWTGQAVVSENLPLENAEFMRTVYGDNVGIWWNYPVTDYLKAKLALGPIIDIDKRLEGKVDFFTMNPMEHANLSKISLATGADYSWNISEYDSDRSWNRSIELLFNDLAPEMKTFANHSTRMNGAWGIGRNDAEDIRSIMNELWLKLSKNQDATQEINKLNDEFENMVKASDTLKSKLPKEILNECLDNLNKLKLLGTNGKIALNMVLAQINNETSKYNQLKGELTKALPSLNSGSRVSEKTVLAFIKEALEYNPLPVVSFKVSKTLVAPGEEIQFINTSSIVTEAYEWTFEGARVEKTTEQNPKVVYEKEGIYTVRLVGKNSLGEGEVIKEDLIIVSNLAKNNRENLALNKKATASSYVNAKEAPQFAIDGSVRTKWCAVGSGKHTLNVDLGEISLVNEIIISHSEEGGEPAGGNTLAYRVEISEDGSNFKELAKVTNNEQGLTKDQVPATKGRYVRLIVDKPTQGDDSAARIYEFAVMGLKGDVELPPKYEKPSISKVELQNLYNENKDKIEEDYTVESWINFKFALNNAKIILDNENTTQGEVDEAIKNLSNAIDNLVVKDENIEEVDKTLLGIFIDYAEDKKTEGALENVVPAVVKEFEDALKEAKEVFADKKATEVQVELASKRLVNAIHMLDFKKGDKAELSKLIEIVNALDENKYTTSTWDKLQGELGKANEVIADENAMEEEIVKVYESLSNAFASLELLSDKSKLEKLVTELESKDLSKYTQGTVYKLNIELDNAKTILANKDVTQGEVDEAYNKLIKAYLDLRLVPDKSKLEELLNKAEGIDISKYTEESIAKLNSELVKARAIFNNEEATENQIEEAQKGLELAMANLEEIAQAGTGNKGNTDKENNNNTNNGDNNVNNYDSNKEIAKGDSQGTTSKASNTGKGSTNGKLPSTGGTSSVALGAMALLIAGVGIVLRKKK